MTERLVVIGGDAGGMAAASQARRRRADLEIIALEKSQWTSYSACGIPYVLAGEVGHLDDLVARSPQEFRDRFAIDVRTGHEATGIDVARGTVDVRDVEQGRAYSLGYDVLHIGTGARPFRPPIPGIDSPDVHGVQTLDDAAHLLEHARAGGVRSVVVVGGGYVGLEIAEAFVTRGCPRVAVVEQAAEVMGTLDPDMGALVSNAMRGVGIDVRTGEAVVGFEPGRVVTEVGGIEADLVILGLGVVPNSALAGDAGIALGERDAIRVDRRQRTSAAGVSAAGDCCESFHLVAQRPVHIALGTVANKQGRVAGINIGGGYAAFAGVVGTAVTKVCSTEVARTGLSDAEAKRYGFEYDVAAIDSTTRAGYYPGAKSIRVKMIAERGSGRVLGAQIVGLENAGKRIDAVAVAITAGMTTEDVLNLDLAYAPPFGPLWDPVQVAARRLVEG